jgi:hypothetical protein
MIRHPVTEVRHRDQPPRGPPSPSSVGKKRVLERQELFVPPLYIVWRGDALEQRDDSL